MQLVPAAKVGHIGLYRDPETALPVEYYCKLPNDIANREVIVLDPMLATGGSAIDAITQIKARGVKNIKFMCIIAAPEGLRALQDAHPDVKIYCASLDDHLDEHKYIIPGLGDAGDRYLRHQVIPVVNQKSGGNFLRFFLLWHGSHSRLCDAEASIAPQRPGNRLHGLPGQRAIKQCPRHALMEKPAQLSQLLRSKKGRGIPASPSDRPGNRLSRYTARRRS